MRILLGTTCLGNGGAERMVCDLADEFYDAGHTVIIITLIDEIKIKPERKKIEIFNLQLTKSPVNIIKSIYKLRLIIKDFNPDIVNTHQYHANIFFRLIRGITRVPVLISSAHNTIEGGPIRSFLYRITNLFSDRFTNVSQEAIDLFELKKIAKKGTMEVVYNGIRTSKFLFSQIERNCKRESLSVPDSCYMILSVGRLVEQKNHKLLLSAIKEVVDMGFVIRLYLVGDGPLRQFLEDRAQELEIENQVFFMPSQKDISSFLCACDVFVLPSSWEGFGLVVTEAMACERKIVATNCGGVEEVLGDVGWLVDRDNLDALVKGILSALNLSKSASQILGKRARKRVLEKFSIEQSGKSYLSMYRDCLKKRT